MSPALIAQDCPRCCRSSPLEMSERDDFDQENVRRNQYLAIRLPLPFFVTAKPQQKTCKPGASKPPHTQVIERHRDNHPFRNKSSASHRPRPPLSETRRSPQPVDVRYEGRNGLSRTAAPLLSLCRFSDAGMRRLSTRCGGRRPKSANARSRCAPARCAGARAERPAAR
jgi:hypothetical protein